MLQTWSNLLARLSDEEFNILLSNKKEFLNAYKPLLDDTEFIISISRDSMKHTSVKLRFDKLNNLLKQFIYDKKTFN